MEIPPELRSLYPNLSDEELIIAKENFDRYLLLAWQIMEDHMVDAPAPDQSIDAASVRPYDLHKGRFQNKKLSKE